MGKVMIVILVIAGIAGLAVFGMYNGLVSKDMAVKNEWAQIDTVLQRRNDLIPNLLTTVKGYATHEREIFANVTDARAKYMGANTLTDKVGAANQLTTFLGRLIAVAENYPQLKADANFRQLMDELAGSENRISVQRMRYNDAVRAYNQALRMVPTNFIAKMFGFESAEFFVAAPEAKAVPKIEF